MSLDPRAMKPSDAKPMATRKAFGLALKDLGDVNENVMVFDADLREDQARKILYLVPPKKQFLHH